MSTDWSCPNCDRPVIAVVSPDGGADVPFGEDNVCEDYNYAWMTGTYYVHPPRGGER